MRLEALEAVYQSYNKIEYIHLQTCRALDQSRKKID
jgi:hypothetical protein